MPGPAPAPDARHQRKIIKYLQRGTISINLQIEDIIAKEPGKRTARDQKCIELRQREEVAIPTLWAKLENTDGCILHWVEKH